MKKLMFAVAAVAASVALADVTSANIVGYQNFPLAGGFNFKVSTFEKVDGSVPTLGDVKCNEIVTWSGTDFQLLDEEGRPAKIEVGELGEVDATFWYWPAEDADEDMPEGWYLFDDDGYPIPEYPQNSRQIPFSQGFILGCGDGSEDDPAVVTFAGSVRGAEYQKELSGGFNVTGNCSPVDCVLGDFTCNEVVTWSGTDFQLLDDEGRPAKIEVGELGEVDATFWYWPAEDADEDMPEGWYLFDDDGYPIPDYPQNLREIKAGQGFILGCGDGSEDDPAIFKIPAAL